MSIVTTFYSYKGGVGRSMSLANTAVMLAKWGHKVLMIDWDLEAPGLEHFFKDYININIVREKIGVINLLNNNENCKWQDGLISIPIPKSQEPIHLLSSGKRDEDYFKEVRKFNIDEFYQQEGGTYIEKLRSEWKHNYDFVLVDSRTGITEIGGICTVQLPDQVVLLFTATDQGFDGTLDIANRALKAQQKLPYDRQKLAFVPVLAKFDTQAEFSLSKKWIDIFAKKLKDIYRDWLPIAVNPAEFIQSSKIPYLTYFSFGEKLPVIEQSLSDAAGLAFAYESLAGIIANKLQDVELLVKLRDQFIINAHKIPPIPQKDFFKKNDQTIRIFLSYAKRDEGFKVRFMSHLSILSKLYNLFIWTDDLLMPGDAWEDELRNNLEKADIVIALVSPDYLRSDFIIKELEQAYLLKKRIVPIRIRESIVNNPILDNLISLPRSRKYFENYKNEEEGFQDIFLELERLIRNIKRNRNQA